MNIVQNNLYKQDFFPIQQKIFKTDKNYYYSYSWKLKL